MDTQPTDRKAQVRGLFDLIAPDYDTAGCFAYFGERLVDAAGLAAGQRVLDVASGRGAVLFPAARRIGPTGAVAGVDLSPEMARATNDEAARRGVPARVEVMDAEELSFADASFDRVLCGFGIGFLAHLDRALAEFRRVLAAEGRVAISTWQASQVHDLGAVLKGLGLQSGEPPGITDPDELARALGSAGFTDATARVDAKEFRYRDVDAYWRNARATGMRRVLDALDADRTARVRAALEERLRDRQREDGIYVEARALLAVAPR